MDEDCKKIKIFPILVGLGITVGLITGLFSLDSRYVTTSQLAVFAQSVDVRLETQRQKDLTDRYYQMRQLKVQYPKDKQLDEDLQAVKQQREESQRTLDNLNKATKQTR